MELLNKFLNQNRFLNNQTLTIRKIFQIPSYDSSDMVDVLTNLEKIGDTE